MTGLLSADLGHMAAQFAETVGAAVARHPTEDPWHPGAAVADTNLALDAALVEAGWFDLADDEHLLPLVAPAAAALGRGFAPLAPVDGLLGGALRHGSLVRYARPGAVVVTAKGCRLQLEELLSMSELPTTDALGVARVETARRLGTVPGEEAERRMLLWIAGSVGYLAGMTAEAMRITVEHARSRIAFGRPLAALEPVQQMLADAAVLSEGLGLLTRDRLGGDALAYAGEAAGRVLGVCQQVTGALGFTLEFPLQRAYRRARSARAWADAVLRAWDDHDAAPA